MVNTHIKELTRMLVVIYVMSFVHTFARLIGVDEHSGPTPFVEPYDRDFFFARPDYEEDFCFHSLQP